MKLKLTDGAQWVMQSQLVERVMQSPLFRHLHVTEQVELRQQLENLLRDWTRRSVARSADQIETQHRHRRVRSARGGTIAGKTVRYGKTR